MPSPTGLVLKNGSKIRFLMSAGMPGPVSPITGQPIHLLEGRYGPYLTDGVTNASLPKQSDPASVTLAEALVRAPDAFAESWNFGPAAAVPVRDVVAWFAQAWGSGADWRVEGGGEHETHRLEIDAAHRLLRAIALAQARDLNHAL